MQKIYRHSIFIIALAIASCSDDSQNDSSTILPKSTDTLKNQVSKTADFDKFMYTLPESNYSFPIEISAIETKTIKDAFVHKEDQYSPEEKVDGYILKIRFKMNNPYDKVIMAPVCNYYYIGTLDNKFFSKSTTRHRECQCDIDNSTQVTDVKGKDLYSLSQGTCGYDDPCIEFKAKETKEFIIKFTDPVYYDVKQLIFSAFHRRGQSANSTKQRDIVLLIDTEKKKVINEMVVFSSLCKCFK